MCEFIKILLSNGSTPKEELLECQFAAAHPENIFEWKT